VRLLLVCALAAVTASAGTRVVGPYYFATGDKASLVECTIAWPSFNTVDGRAVLQGSLKFNVLKGVVNLDLEPTDTAVPQFTYEVSCSDGKTPRREQWSVPTSATPVSASAVRLLNPPPKSYAVQWQQLDRNGAAVGQMPLWTGSSWKPGNLTWTADVNALEYSDGFIAITNGSTDVTGIGTSWTAEMSGRWLFTLPCGEVYQVTFLSSTQGVLDRPYRCDTAEKTRYTLTQSTWVLAPASQPGLGTTNLSVQCYAQAVDNQFSSAAVAARMYPANVLIYVTGDVEILWRTAKKGQCLISR
jgi:hypothetical protein